MAMSCKLLDLQKRNKRVLGERNRCMCAMQALEDSLKRKRRQLSECLCED
jgi:hypothetical protein